MKCSNIDTYIISQEGFESLDRASLEALQLQKLNHMFRRMRAHGRGDLPMQVESLAELSSLPFTSPEDLAMVPERYLLTSQADIARIITDHTSGTMAAAKRVFYTEGDLLSTVDFFAAGISEMARKGDTVLITMPFSGSFGLGDLIKNAVEKIGAYPLCAGWGKSYAVLSSMVCAYQPACYIGFPVPLLSMARYMGESFSVKRALISGDVCPSEINKVLSEQFELYPHYGSREMCLGGAITCPAFQGMHVRENHFIAEIIGDDGHPVPDGEEGELVITTIGMLAMPLLRYRTGDWTHILPEKCPCGSVTKRIALPSRIGRDADLLSALDDAIFVIPDVIDTFIERKGDVVRILALCKVECKDIIRRSAEKIYPKIEVSCVICEGYHTPLYPAKRKIVIHEVGV